MFAGRYLWWMLMAIAGFVFLAVYFDYVGWTIVQFSGCEKNAGSCGPLISFLGGVVKPVGFWLCGIVVFASIVARILYLRMNMFWALAAAVWFAGSASLPGIFVGFWEGHVEPKAIIDLLPLPSLFLTAFAAYLLIPFEDDARQALGPWKWPRYAAGIAVGQAALWTAAKLTDLPAFLAARLHMPGLGAAIAHLQPRLDYLAELGSGSTAPVYLALWVFLLALLAGLLPPLLVEPWLTSLRQLISPEQPRRRSGRA